MKWELGYQLGLRAPTRDARLDRGTVWHRGMEELFRPGRDRADSIAAAWKVLWEAPSLFQSLPDVEPEHMHWMLEGYLKRWGDEDADSPWVPTLTEHRIEAPLMTYDGIDVIFTGYVDCVLVHARTGAWKIRDYKSRAGANLASESFNSDIRLEPQFPLYQRVLTRAGHDVSHSEIDYARTDRLKRPMTLAERFARPSLHRPDHELDWIWGDFTRATRAMLRVRFGDDEAYSSYDARVCSWKCDFRVVHEQIQATGMSPVEAARGFGFTTRAEREALAPDPDSSDIRELV
jgi:hypothetical protein